MKPLRNRVRPGNVCKSAQKASNSQNNDDPKTQDPVEVFCRLRPLIDSLDNICVLLSSPKLITLTPPDYQSRNRKVMQYEFKHVFTEHSHQKEIFEHVALPLLEGLLHGKNGLLFTYGVTGSGKTFTMTGDSNDPGVMPRCIDALFNTIVSYQAPKYIIKSDKMNGFEVQSDADALEDRVREAKLKQKSTQKKHDSGTVNYSNDGRKLFGVDEDSLYAVFISYTEIYNNTVYDLLDESAGLRTLQPKILREDSSHNMYVNSVVELEVKSSEEAFELFNFGQKRKRMAHTTMNAESSRSHSIFNIRLVQGQSDVNGEHLIRDRSMLIIGQLSLVDLAGSERCSRTQTTGQRLKEAGSINNSLMSLRTCLEILRENQQMGMNRIVPYRESRLTHLFKHFFDGEGKVEMIVCINPSVKDYDETVQVMKFAEITQEVKISRPEVKIPQSDDLLPGRRVACKLLAAEGGAAVSKDTCFSVIESSVPITQVTMPEHDVINTLTLYLKTRQQNRVILRSRELKKRTDFRNRLNRLHKANLISKSEINSLNYLLQKEKKLTNILNIKITNLEVQHDDLIRVCDDKERIIDGLQITVKEKNFKINQNLLDKEKNKRKLAAASEKMTHELDSKLRRQREYLHAAMKEKTDKLELVKDILLKDGPVQKDYEVQATHTLNTEVDNRVSTQTDDANTAHIPRREAPVANVRYRRSKSTSDVWLEHIPGLPTPLGTVLQPVIKRRKSITKLTDVKDIVGHKQSRYLLIDQGKDDAGDLETKLYKGDIIPTCSGGAQVIFDDVEKLKQESPKASSSKKPTLRRAHDNVGDKCSIGIEGHAKKSRK